VMYFSRFRSTSRMHLKLGPIVFVLLLVLIPYFSVDYLFSSEKEQETGRVRSARRIRSVKKSERELLGQDNNGFSNLPKDQLFKIIKSDVDRIISGDRISPYLGKFEGSSHIEFSRIFYQQLVRNLELTGDYRIIESILEELDGEKLQDRSLLNRTFLAILGTASDQDISAELKVQIQLFEKNERLKMMFSLPEILERFGMTSERVAISQELFSQFDVDEKRGLVNGYARSGNVEVLEKLIQNRQGQEGDILIDSAITTMVESDPRPVIDFILDISNQDMRTYCLDVAITHLREIGATLDADVLAQFTTQRRLVNQSAMPLNLPDLNLSLLPVPKNGSSTLWTWGDLLRTGEECEKDIYANEWMFDGPPEAKSLMVRRDPVERFISGYRNSWDKRGLDGGFSEFVRWCPAMVWQERAKFLSSLKSLLPLIIYFGQKLV
jgi:hypothetical protein